MQQVTNLLLKETTGKTCKVINLIQDLPLDLPRPLPGIRDLLRRDCEYNVSCIMLQEMSGNIHRPWLGTAESSLVLMHEKLEDSDPILLELFKQQQACHALCRAEMDMFRMDQEMQKRMIQVKIWLFLHGRVRAYVLEEHVA